MVMMSGWIAADAVDTDYNRGRVRKLVTRVLRADGNRCRPASVVMNYLTSIIVDECFERHFLPRYLRKHFHVLACNRNTFGGMNLGADTSLVVYCNHASWWDPMTAMYVRSQIMPAHKQYAPIDAEALEQYKIFKSMASTVSRHRIAARPSFSNQFADRQIARLVFVANARRQILRPATA